MDALLMYLLKMVICSGILYGYYRLALYNENFHQWNRFYLLSSMLLSVVVPFINIPLFTTVDQGNFAEAISSLPWNYSGQEPVKAEMITWQNVILVVAAIVSFVLVVRIIATVTRLVVAYHSNPVSNLNDRVQLILTKFSHAPFSFFSWLFWRHDIDPASETGQRMLTHELTHINQRHSIDKLFTELLLCLFWMNPFFWLMRRELGIIHEFIADRKAIVHKDGAAFAKMILQAMHVQPKFTAGLVNPFFSSQIKRRLLMITTSKEPKFSYLRRVSGLVLMVCAALTLAFSIQRVEAQQNEKQVKKMKEQQVSVTDTISATKKKSGKLVVVQIKPSAADNDTTVFNKNSELVIVSSDGEKLNLRLNSEKGKTGRISLNDQETAGEIDNLKVTGDFDKVAARNGSTPPLYIYDGKEMSKEELNNISPDNIASINVVKGSQAVEEFGEKGKHGVVIISSKKTDRIIADNPITVKGYKKEKSPTTVTGFKINGVMSIIYVNGKEISEEEMKNVKPNDIESINVLKDDKAVEKYGERAKNGVIEIKMKTPVS